MTIKQVNHLMTKTLSAGVFDLMNLKTKSLSKLLTFHTISVLRMTTILLHNPLKVQKILFTTCAHTI
jgi:hypothetical protein